jgi:hypothetical protein
MAKKGSNPPPPMAPADGQHGANVNPSAPAFRPPPPPPPPSKNND